LAVFLSIAALGVIVGRRGDEGGKGRQIWRLRTAVRSAALFAFSGL